MANWKRQIDLSDLYAKFENDEIDNKEMLTGLRWAWYNFIDHNPYVQLLDDFYRLDDAVEELGIVESLEEADYLLETIYDFCDENRICVKTF